MKVYQGAVGRFRDAAALGGLIGRETSARREVFFGDHPAFSAQALCFGQRATRDCFHRLVAHLAAMDDFTTRRGWWLALAKSLRRGLHVEPPSVRGGVKYLGPALRTFTYRRRDQRRARAKLGLAADATVITVLPGSWTEAMAPAYEAIVTAFNRLAGADEHLLKLRVSDRLDIKIFGANWQV